MTPAEARAFVDRLIAAFPFPRRPQATIDLYVGELAELKDREAALASLTSIIRTGDRFPTVAAIRTEYQAQRRRRAHDRADTHGLPEPDGCPAPPEVHRWLDEHTRRRGSEREAA
jgi:hypothetical protein